MLHLTVKLNLPFGEGFSEGVLNLASKDFPEPLCANNAETPYPCYIGVEGRDEKEDGKQSNGCGGSRVGDPDDEWRRA
jgi:hypothetical protein